MPELIHRTGECSDCERLLGCLVTDGGPDVETIVQLKIFQEKMIGLFNNVKIQKDI